MRRTRLRFTFQPERFKQGGDGLVTIAGVPQGKRPDLGGEVVLFRIGFGHIALGAAGLPSTRQALLSETGNLPGRGRRTCAAAPGLEVSLRTLIEGSGCRALDRPARVLSVCSPRAGACSP